jgi:F0F1-type ATP synthase assembly protein I
VSINLIERTNEYSLKTIRKKVNNVNYKLYTPEIIKKYKNSLKEISKITNNNTKSKFIIYEKVCKWYKDEADINLKMEKIHIKTKLGSFTSGGCGIGASLFAGITASAVFSYMDNYIKRLAPFFLVIYLVLVVGFGIKFLYKEDEKVEMYNMFLEVLESLENDNNEN